MSNCRLCLSMLLLGSISLGNFGCSSEEENQSNQQIENNPASPVIKEIDLSEAFELRIQGRTNEAIELLRSLNEKHPTSFEVMVQLARALLDAKQFSLAAFRFEQALSLNQDNSVTKEAAEAHYLAADIESSIERYKQYLLTEELDPSSQLRLARMLADSGRTTESINAFSKVSNEASADDCLIMGNLFLQKKLLSQAKHWYGESSNRSNNNSTTLPLLGLLKVAQLEKNEEDTETLILALEKSDPGIIEKSELADFSATFLRRKRLADFIAKGMDVRGKSVTELASALLAGKAYNFRQTNNVTGISKLPPPREDVSTDPKEDLKKEKAIDTAVKTSPVPSTLNSMSLADAFAAPIGYIESVSGASESPLELGQKAYLDGSYTSALLHARDALKENSQDAQAWKLCSQAHFQLGETNQAEMTILEAIRHQPFDLDMQMDYLRIARETLPSKRYLQELEKVRDLFPDSTEILWELARRYHIVENMPVTAAVLYRKIIQIAPSNSAIAGQAELELIKLRK